MNSKNFKRSLSSLIASLTVFSTLGSSISTKVYAGGGTEYAVVTKLDKNENPTELRFICGIGRKRLATCIIVKCDDKNLKPEDLKKLKSVIDIPNVSQQLLGRKSQTKIPLEIFENVTDSNNFIFTSNDVENILKNVKTVSTPKTGIVANVANKEDAINISCEIKNVLTNQTNINNYNALGKATNSAPSQPKAQETPKHNYKGLARTTKGTDEEPTELRFAYIYEDANIEKTIKICINVKCDDEHKNLKPEDLKKLKSIIDNPSVNFCFLTYDSKICENVTKLNDFIFTSDNIKNIYDKSDNYKCYEIIRVLTDSKNGNSEKLKALIEAEESKNKINTASRQISSTNSGETGKKSEVPAQQQNTSETTEAEVIMSKTERESFAEIHSPAESSEIQHTAKEFNENSTNTLSVENPDSNPKSKQTEEVNQSTTENKSAIPNVTRKPGLFRHIWEGIKKFLSKLPLIGRLFKQK